MRRYGLYAEKVGMTSIFEEKGRVFPVTVLRFLDFKILDGFKSTDDRMKLFFAGGSKLKMPQAKLLEKEGLKFNNGFFREMKKQENASFADFEGIRFVDVQGISKGKGTCGVMKRWNFHGGPASHGASKSHRLAGSTGMRTEPGKTYKGRKMAGRMGHETVTQQNLEIIRTEGDLIFLKGAVPGNKKGHVFVSKAIKKGERNNREVK